MNGINGRGDWRRKRNFSLNIFTKLESVSLELADDIRRILFLHMSPSRRMYVTTGCGCGCFVLVSCNSKTKKKLVKIGLQRVYRDMCR